MLETFLLVGLGFLGITIIDRVWFFIEYKKAERGLEVLEHYHYGIIAIGISIIIFEIINPLAVALMAIGFGFIYHEAKQERLFAWSSPHFKPSTIIGVSLAGVTIIIYFITNYLF